MTWRKAIACQLARFAGASGRHRLETLLPVVLAIAAAATIGVAFFSLLSHDNPRCWEWVEYNGRTEWKSVSAPEGIFQGPGMPSHQEVGPLPPGATSAGSQCTSDAITGSEAARGLGILAAGALLAAGAGRYGREKGCPK